MRAWILAAAALLSVASSSSKPSVRHNATPPAAPPAAAPPAPVSLMPEDPQKDGIDDTLDKSDNPECFACGMDTCDAEGDACEKGTVRDCFRWDACICACAIAHGGCGLDEALLQKCQTENEQAANAPDDDSGSSDDSSSTMSGGDESTGDDEGTAGSDDGSDDDDSSSGP